MKETRKLQTLIYMLQNAWLSEIKSKIAVAKENDPFVFFNAYRSYRAYGQGIC